MQHPLPGTTMQKQLELVPWDGTTNRGSPVFLHTHPMHDSLGYSRWDLSPVFLSVSSPGWAMGSLCPLLYKWLALVHSLLPGAPATSCHPKLNQQLHCNYTLSYWMYCSTLSTMLLWMGSVGAVGSEMTAKILLPTLLEKSLYFANICHNVATRLLLPGFCDILKINIHIFTFRHGCERPVGESVTSSSYTHP